MLQVTNLRQFRFSLEAEKARLTKTLTNKYKAYVQLVFKDLVTHSPQWSGHLTANWQLLLTNEVVGGVYPWKTKPFQRPALQRGDPAAVNFAIGNSLHKIEKIRWNTKVTFANPVEYGDELESGLVPVRPVNLVRGRVALAQYIASKYSRTSGGTMVLGAGS